MNLTSDCDWRGDKVGAFYAHLSQAHRMKFLVAKEKVRAAVARNQKKANPISTQLSTGKSITLHPRLLWNSFDNCGIQGVGTLLFFHW